jgi:AraC-like DNA-binding protein
MGTTLAEGLERSCAADRIRAAPGAPGMERVAARFAGEAFAPHRHDCYALGITTEGLQAFRYRGAERLCLPGEAQVLHPDELHDGYAAGEAGFGYRIVYVAPALLRAALGENAALPFVREAVTRDPRLVGALRAALADLSRPLEPLERDVLVTALADALGALAGAPARAQPLDLPALERARALLDEGEADSIALECATGLDRFTLARQFRRCWGTSPHRYRVLRRLERARAAMAAGEGLAAAAALAGFADQAHLTRQFKQAFGLTPGRWRSLTQ